MNTKLLSLLLVLALMIPALGLTESAVMLPNPVREATREEVLEATGANLLVPEEATEVSYSLIEVPDQEPLGQVRFVYQQAEYLFRAQQGNDPADISGMYLDWDTVTQAEKAPFSGTICLDESGDGIALWRYEKEGYNFALVMFNAATEDGLLEMSALLLPDLGEA